MNKCQQVYVRLLKRNETPLSAIESGNIVFSGSIWKETSEPKMIRIKPRPLGFFYLFPRAPALQVTNFLV